MIDFWISSSSMQTLLVAGVFGYESKDGSEGRKRPRLSSRKPPIGKLVLLGVGPSFRISDSTFPQSEAREFAEQFLWGGEMEVIDTDAGCG
jgi:hypothetical protein